MTSRSSLMEAADDFSIEFDRGELETPKKTFKHPVAVFFHLVFRISAVLAYLLCEWFSNSFIASFVFIVLLLSMDFWTVKNISGRLLVGLRWWNYIDDSGQSHWVFESRKGEEALSVNSAETRVFWIALVLGSMMWTFFFFVAIFRLNFKWFMVVCIGIILNGANLWGYLRCKIKNRQKLSDLASNFLGQQVLQNMMSSVSKNKQEESTQTKSTFEGSL